MLEQYAAKQRGPDVNMPALLEDLAGLCDDDWREVIESLLFNDYLTLSSLEQELGWNRDQSRALLSWMSRNRLVKMTSRQYYRKTDVGNRFLHWAQVQGREPKRRY